jgi:hypothetical protein
LKSKIIKSPTTTQNRRFFTREFIQLLLDALSGWCKPC